MAAIGAEGLVEGKGFGLAALAADEIGLGAESLAHDPATVSCADSRSIELLR